MVVRNLASSHSDRSNADATLVLRHVAHTRVGGAFRNSEPDEQGLVQGALFGAQSLAQAFGPFHPN